MSRKMLAAVALVALVFGLGYPLRDLLLRKAEPARASGAVTSPPSAAGMTITAWQGSVERRRATASDWQPLTADAQIRDHDALRTGEGASAVLTATDGLRLELAEQSQFEVNALGARSNVLLESGRLMARLPSRRAKLQVEIRGNPTVIESDDGAFAVMRNHDGQVTVATTEGRTAVRAQGEGVELVAGEQSIVPVDRAPSPPSRIPASLFLKVARSGPTRSNKRETELGGSTAPGAVVRVNGVPVEIDDSGHFIARVPLREGDNAFDVVAQDALGRVQREHLSSVRVDTRAPKLQGKLVW
jgi:hypothetical protein